MTKDKQIPDHILNSKDSLRDSLSLNKGNPFKNQIDADKEQYAKELARDKENSKYDNIYRDLSKLRRKQIDTNETDLNNPLRHFAYQFNQMTKGNNKFDISKLKYEKNRYMKGPSDWKKTKGEFSEIQRTKELGREEKFERNKQIMHPKDSLDFKEHADKEQRDLDESTKESFRQRDERLAFSEKNRDTANDPFKGTSIEGKD